MSATAEFKGCKQKCVKNIVFTEQINKCSAYNDIDYMLMKMMMILVVVLMVKAMCEDKPKCLASQFTSKSTV